MIISYAFAAELIRALRVVHIIWIVHVISWLLLLYLWVILIPHVCTTLVSKVVSYWLFQFSSNLFWWEFATFEAPDWCEKAYGFLINEALISVLHHNQSKMKFIFLQSGVLKRLTPPSPVITPQVSFSNQTFIYCHLPSSDGPGKTYFSPLLRPSAIVGIISRLRM